MQENQIVVLIQMFEGVISDVMSFSGKEAFELAASHFKAWTGLPYAEYRQLRVNGERNDDVLGEDYEGTEIYISHPNVPIDMASEFGSRAAWLADS
ncbi:hypothetical protein [Paenibacillus jiagnxiensis]|uniref:hypothetical protein n=1 Tax=Paenibacillus jiagnxiensis TaxID=3228926 RepID=UPI0033BBEEAF